MTPINHSGIITGLTPQQAQILIERADSCHNCSHKEHCAVFQHKQQIISVPLSAGADFAVGERVQITTAERNAWIALLFGCVIPLLLVISTLVICILSGRSETFAALSSLLALLPYYAALRLFNPAFSKRMNFQIKKSD